MTALLAESSRTFYCRLVLAVVAMTALNAEADRWLPFENQYAQGIADCDPDPGTIENETLRTYSWPRGVITFKHDGPGWQYEDGSLNMKFHWERKIRGSLSIRGNRLDGDAPPLRARITDAYGDTGFQATSVIFPSPGCWEVTGSVAGNDLTFRVYVIKVPGEYTLYPLQEDIQVTQ